MPKTAPYSSTAATLKTAELKRFADGWLLDGEVRQLSPRTQDSRERLIRKLLWFLGEKGLASCGKPELRAFLAYVSRGHEDPGGRWGNPRMDRPVKPGTSTTYYNILRSLYRFLVDEGALEASPVETLRPPVARPDQIQPFTDEQIAGLLTAARRCPHPCRDEAILLFLLDTGARASEVCSLRVRDVDLTGRRCTVQGKGSKTRRLCFGRSATKALWSYLKEQSREPDDALFLADRGTRAGEPLTRSGLGQIIRRLGRAAGIETARCSPHTFRHTFAYLFLKAGGNVFTLKELLGHTTLTMVNRYVALAQADIETQHRIYSPADRLKRR